MARRDLMIQKLRESMVSRQVQMVPAEIDAYLAQHREELAPKPSLGLRSLAFSTADDAEKVRQEIVKRQKSFAQAVTAYGRGHGEGEIQEVTLDSLPDEVRSAVAGLKRGQISKPVTVQDATYLFYVESAPKAPAIDAESLRTRAAEDLLQQKYAEASSRFLAELRAKAKIELHLQNLPFHYVPESAP